MSPIQPSKRRRLNTATNTLSQPFKSPFKTPLKSNPDASSSPTKEPPSPPASSPPPKPDDQATDPTSPPPAPRPAPTTTTTPLPHQHTPPSPSPSHLPLQKQHTLLLNHLSAARASLETSAQALKIESSPQDHDLQLLIAKWKNASRAAAEEVFTAARDKVNRMGGVRAMRERERERGRGGGSYGWDEYPRVVDEEGGRVDVDEVDPREEGAGVAGGGDDEEEEGEGGYTMDLMLRSLNVELGVIGFDGVLQRWVD